MLAWLSVACRSAERENLMVYCSPVVTVNLGGWGINIGHEISDIEEVDSAVLPSSLSPPSCWRRIFNNAAITYGYPILRRTEAEKGLRISLEMMTTLAQTSYATIYDGTLLLKGLCSMYVPVLQTASSIVWHYLLNDDLSWMSHDQAQKNCQEIAQIDFSALSKSNHFVG